MQELGTFSPEKAQARPLTLGRPPRLLLGCPCPSLRQRSWGLPKIRQRVDSVFWPGAARRLAPPPKQEPPLTPVPGATIVRLHRWRRPKDRRLPGSWGLRWSPRHHRHHPPGHLVQPVALPVGWGKLEEKYGPAQEIPLKEDTYQSEDGLE